MLTTSLTPAPPCPSPAPHPCPTQSPTPTWPEGFVESPHPACLLHAHRAPHRTHHAPHAPHAPHALHAPRTAHRAPRTAPRTTRAPSVLCSVLRPGDFMEKGTSRKLVILSDTRELKLTSSAARHAAGADLLIHEATPRPAQACSPTPAQACNHAHRRLQARVPRPAPLRPQPAPLCTQPAAHVHPACSPCAASLQPHVIPGDQRLDR